MDRIDNDWTRIDQSMCTLAKDTADTIQAMELGRVKATEEEIKFMKDQLARLIKAYKLIFKYKGR